MHKTARGLLLVIVTLLLLFGVVMLYSTSYTAYDDSILRKQLVWIMLGASGAVTTRCLDYRLLGRHAKTILAVVALLLAYLGIAAVARKVPGLPGIFHDMPLVGDPVKGGFRWLRFGGFSIQPSEFAKICIIIFLANYFGNNTRRIGEAWRGFALPVGTACLVVGLIFMGKDFSTSVITGATVYAVAFIAGVRLRYLLIMLLLGIVFSGIVLKTSPERLRRIKSFRDPEMLQKDEGYQLWSSQLALGSGGLKGRGFTESRMKHMYLPEAHTDFIVAIIGEELGFVAVACLVIAYFGLVVVTFWTAMLAVDREGTLLCSGIGLLLGLQAFVNIGVVSGFLPTTGVTAPFLSYGGSSMIASLCALGLLLSVGRIAEAEAASGGIQPQTARNPLQHREEPSA